MSSITVFFLVCLGLFAVTSWQSFALNLPVLTAAQQCIDRGYRAACKPHSKAEMVVHHCVSLACAKKVRDEPKIYIRELIGPPLNGTFCGASKICVNKRCKLVNKNEIPKYFGSKKQRKCIHV